MTLSDAAIKKPVFAWMLMCGLLVLGGLGGPRLGISKMPDVDYPQVSVDLTLEGAAPEVMETDVVEFVEDACMAVEGIRTIRSSSQQGRASVTLEFEQGKDIDAALQDVQTRVAQAQRRLPRELDPPVVTKNNPEDRPILWVAVSGPRSPQFVSDFARFTIKDRLQVIPGVGEIQMGGFRERNVRAWVDGRRLDAHGLTVTDVVDAVAREHLELPSGRIESASREMNVRTQGEALDLEEFRDLVVREDAGSVVRLRDVAVVEDGLEDRRRIARSNGFPAQGLGVKKQRGANAVAVARAVRAEVERLKPTLPDGMSLGITFDSTREVEESVHEILFTMLLAVLFTGIVCWLFLGSLSSTINVLLAIPTSLAGTFAAMYFLGFTLNTFTLLGLSLAVGIVVDDAIMVLENIHRRAEGGEPRVRAAVTGAREICFAAMAATAAIVAIFLPVAFMRGIIGAFFFQFGVTISIAVLLSLLEALTLTPSRCAQFMETGERRSAIGRRLDAFFEGLASAYRRSLPATLRRRWLVLLAGVAAFGSSLLLVPRLRQEMVPPQDIGIFMARLRMPVGTAVDTMDGVVRRCEAILGARGDILRWMASVGGFGGGDVSSGVMFVTLAERPVRTLTTQQVMAEVRRDLNAIPGLRASMQDLSQEGFTSQRGYPIELRVTGPDWDRLGEAARAVMDRMETSPLYADVDTDYQLGMPEVRVLPDRDRAAAAGVSMDDIARTVNALVGGVRAGKFKDGARRYDIRIRLLAGQRIRPEDIASLRVRAANGDLLPLGSLVRIEEAPSLRAITRTDRDRSIGITANVGAGQSQATAVANLEAIGKEVLPPGYRLVLSGSAETLRETFRELVFALVLGIVVAYMILASQFNSLAHPITVLAALPFSLSGAIVGLALFDLSLNIYSFIGVILLMGIVKKNSILMVDFTNQRRVEGLGREEAMLEACPARLRPILMTSVSTIAAALPAAFAWGPGAELRQPMAIAVVGGVVASTALTLWVVPALYSILDDLVLRFGSASRIESETARVLADLQVEEIERHRTRTTTGVGSAGAPPAAPAG